MTTPQNRVQSGVPTGGQFAAAGRAEASVSLNDGYGDSPTSWNPDDIYEAGMRDVARLDAARPAPARTAPEPLAVARTLHQRHCAACGGADPICIRVEEEFLPEVTSAMGAPKSLAFSA